MGIYVYVVTRKVVGKLWGEPVYGYKFAYKPTSSGYGLNEAWRRKFVDPSSRAWDRAGGVRGALVTRLNNEDKIEYGKPVLLERYDSGFASFVEETPAKPVAIAVRSKSRANFSRLIEYENRYVRNTFSNLAYTLTDPDKFFVEDLGGLTFDIDGVVRYLKAYTGVWEVWGNPRIVVKERDGETYKVYLNEDGTFLEYGVALEEDLT